MVDFKRGLKRVFVQLVGTTSSDDEGEKKIDHLTTEGLTDYDLFTPRGNEVEKGLNFLKSNQKLLIVEGKPGIGKTSYLAILKRAIMENMIIEKEIPPNISEVKGLNSNPKDLLQNIFKQWNLSFEAEDPIKRPQTLKKQMKDGKRYILYLDGISKIKKMEEKNQKDLIEFLENLVQMAVRKEEKKKIQIVITGDSEISDFLKSQSKILGKRIDKTIKLKPYEYEKAEKYMERYLIYSDVPPYLLTQPARRKIFEISEGLPEKMNKILLKLVQDHGGGVGEQEIDESDIVELEEEQDPL